MSLLLAQGEEQDRMSACVRMGRFVKEQRSRQLVRSGAEPRSSSASLGLRLGTSGVSSVALPDAASSSFRLLSPPQVKWEQQN